MRTMYYFQIWVIFNFSRTPCTSFLSLTQTYKIRQKSGQTFEIPAETGYPAKPKIRPDYPANRISGTSLFANSKDILSCLISTRPKNGLNLQISPFKCSQKKLGAAAFPLALSVGKFAFLSKPVLTGSWFRQQLDLGQFVLLTRQFTRQRQHCSLAKSLQRQVSQYRMVCSVS